MPPGPATMPISATFSLRLISRSRKVRNERKQHTPDLITAGALGSLRLPRNQATAVDQNTYVVVGEIGPTREAYILAAMENGSFEVEGVADEWLERTEVQNRPTRLESDPSALSARPRVLSHAVPRISI